MKKLLAQICRGRLSKGAYWKHISLLSIVIFILLLFVGHYSEGDDFWPNNIRIGVFMFFLIVYISVQCAIIFTPHLAIRRHHQIRVQLAHIGCIIKGDLKYGANRSNKDGGIHLHSKQLAFLHPIKKNPIIIEAPTPKDAIWDLVCNF